MRQCEQKYQFSFKIILSSEVINVDVEADLNATIEAVAELSQNFNNEGDSGRLYVYARLEDGSTLDISSNDLRILPPDNTFSVQYIDGVNGNDGYYELTVVPGAISQYGRFVTVEWIDANRYGTYLKIVNIACRASGRSPTSPK